MLLAPPTFVSFLDTVSIDAIPLAAWASFSACLAALYAFWYSAGCALLLNGMLYLLSALPIAAAWALLFGV